MAEFEKASDMLNFMKRERRQTNTVAPRDVTVTSPFWDEQSSAPPLHNISMSYGKSASTVLCRYVLRILEIFFENL
jgi:hypothetical protein